MEIDAKEYTYHNGKDQALDIEFAGAVPYGKIKLSKNVIFWKVTLRWFGVPFTDIRRVYRRVEEVNAKMCCGRASFDIQKLMLVLKDGSTLELLIGDNDRYQAQNLFQAIKEAHPDLQYGKPED